jgi:hypothetical protein
MIQTRSAEPARSKASASLTFCGYTAKKLIPPSHLNSSPAPKMNFYSNRNLWNNETQIRRIFGWADLLKEWNDTLTPSVYVTTVIDNLRAASNPASNYDFPLSHFVTFLNDEQEGLKWLIYEIIAQRWMYSNTRTDYLAELVDRVDVDTHFPPFVGSPLNTKTVREFLEENLSREERREVNMIPRLEPQTNATVYSFWGNSNRTNVIGRSSNVPRPAVKEKHPSCFQLRILQAGKEDLQGEGSDTVLSIYKTANDLYKLIFNDKEANVKNATRDMSRQDVLRYLSVYLRSLAIDDDPVASVQVLPPNAPTTLYNLDKIDRSFVRDLIYDSLELTMDNWPQQLRV